MIPWIIILIIGIVVTVCCLIADAPILDLSDIFTAIIRGGLAIALVVVIWFCVSTVACLCLGEEEYLYAEYNIEALKDNFKVNGKFADGLFVSSGYINSDLNYYYIINTKRGRKMYHVAADKAYIQYSNTEEPHVEIYHTRPKSKPWQRDVFWLVGEDLAMESVTLVIPPGSITAEGKYEIDME